LSKGIEQRVLALNAFLYDIYHKQGMIGVTPPPAAVIPKL
jgi:uncharacterized circularly permuted ATP-grasp superfamily protein